jgi:4-deoxy-L-threo-5-hexosulose-uronate ketol-isomerase
MTFWRIHMDIRHAVHPDHFKTLDADALRRHFLVERVFEEDKVNLVYSHIDRIIVGGVHPVRETLPLEVTKAFGVDYFLQRREMGVINIGSQGTVLADGVEYVLGNREGLYIGMGCRDIAFRSSDTKSPAKFYFNSTPAHCAYPIVAVSKSNAQQVKLGSPEKSNLRTINQFVHPNVLKSCQLVMGMT